MNRKRLKVVRVEISTVISEWIIELRQRVATVTKIVHL